MVGEPAHDSRSTPPARAPPSRHARLHRSPDGVDAHGLEPTCRRWQTALRVLTAHRRGPSPKKPSAPGTIRIACRHEHSCMAKLSERVSRPRRPRAHWYLDPVHAMAVIVCAPCLGWHGAATPAEFQSTPGVRRVRWCRRGRRPTLTVHRRHGAPASTGRSYQVKHLPKAQRRQLGANSLLDRGRVGSEPPDGKAASTSTGGYPRA